MWRLTDLPKVKHTFSYCQTQEPIKGFHAGFQKLLVCGPSLKAFGTSSKGSCPSSVFGKLHLFQNPLSWLKMSQQDTGLPAKHTAGIQEHVAGCIMCSELSRFPAWGYGWYSEIWEWSLQVGFHCGPSLIQFFIPHCCCPGGSTTQNLLLVQPEHFLWPRWTEQNKGKTNEEGQKATPTPDFRRTMCKWKYCHGS